MTEIEAPKERKVVGIRKATPADIIKIYRVIKDAFDETTVAFPPVDEANSIAWIHSVITNGLVYVAEYAGRIVGSLGMNVDFFPWARQEHARHLNTAWLYVHPKYRKTGAADALVNKSLEFAKATNMLATFGIMMDHNVELKERFLKMKGMDYVGASFIYQRHIKGEKDVSTKPV